MLPSLLGLASKVNTLLDRMSSANATAISTNLDSPVSDCAQTSDGWDAALATKLDAQSFCSQSVEYTTGSGSFPVPDDVSLVWVTMVGGGGSGAVYRGNVTTNDVGGGGSGATIYRMPFKVTPGGTVAYAAGAGGAAKVQSTDGSTAGAEGTDTTWGTGTGQLVAPGGGAGTLGGGGPAGTIYADNTVHSLNGNTGGFNSSNQSSAAGASTLFAGGDGDTGASGCLAGGGAASALGPGGDAAGNPAGAATATAGTRGGGGGAAAAHSGTATSGAGGAGYILVEWVGPAS